MNEPIYTSPIYNDSLIEAYKLAKANDFNDPYQSQYEALLIESLGHTPTNSELDIIEANLETLIANS